jgi:hypothetical protein
MVVRSTRLGGPSHPGPASNMTRSRVKPTSCVVTPSGATVAPIEETLGSLEGMPGADAKAIPVSSNIDEIRESIRGRYPYVTIFRVSETTVVLPIGRFHSTKTEFIAITQDHGVAADAWFNEIGGRMRSQSTSSAGWYIMRGPTGSCFGPVLFCECGQSMAQILVGDVDRIVGNDVCGLERLDALPEPPEAGWTYRIHALESWFGLLSSALAEQIGLPGLKTRQLRGILEAEAREIFEGAAVQRPFCLRHPYGVSPRGLKTPSAVFTTSATIARLAFTTS